MTFRANNLICFGQRVRVMQTVDMEDCGLANRYGTVMHNQHTFSHLVVVALDEAPDCEELHVELPSHSLMRIPLAAVEAAKGGE